MRSLFLFILLLLLPPSPRVPANAVGTPPRALLHQTFHFILAEYHRYFFTQKEKEKGGEWIRSQENRRRNTSSSESTTCRPQHVPSCQHYSAMPAGRHRHCHIILVARWAYAPPHTHTHIDGKRCPACMRAIRMRALFSSAPIVSFLNRICLSLYRNTFNRQLYIILLNFMARVLFRIQLPHHFSPI